MRTSLKRAAETALCLGGFTKWSRQRNRARTVVLAYHNIVPEDEAIFGDLSLHLRQRDFARQLDLLSRTHEIVSVTDLMMDASGARPRAAITFDDAYRGAVTVGVAELARRGMPATIFVAPAFVGGASFWWDALAAEQTGLSPALRDQALNQLAGSDARVRDWAAAHGTKPRSVPAHQQVASEAELAAAVATGVVTLGSHTWSHPNLTQLDQRQLEKELTQPLQWLQSRFDNSVLSISYPYGLHSTAVENAAAAAGYEMAFLISGGWLPRARARDVNRYALPRLNVPAGLSLHGFEMRVSGVRMH